MKAKRFLCLLLSLVLVLALAAPASAADETAAEETAEELPEYIIRMMNASDAYAPDTEVLTMGGQTITWDVYYYLLTQELQTYLYYMGDLPESFGEIITGEVTVDRYLKESALSYAKYYATVYAKAAEYGLELTADEEAEQEQAWTALTERYGGEEALAELMRESCMSREVYMYLLRSNTLMAKLMDELYGTNGEKLTDAEVLGWAEEAGYVRTKHILYQYTGGEAAEDATEEEKTAAAEQDKADVRARAEATLAGLEELSGEELLTRFDELMAAESEDPGSTTYPDGYVFASGTMVAPFEEAAFALEDNAISGVVETDYGCHIILRLPLEPDSVTMDQDSNTGAPLTLRVSAVNSLYNDRFIEWIGEGSPEWEPGFEELDLDVLFSDRENHEKDADGLSKSAKTLIIVLAVLAAGVIVLFVLLRKKQDKMTGNTDGLLAAETEAEEAAEEAGEEAVETVEEAVEETVEAAEETVEAVEEAAEDEETSDKQEKPAKILMEAPNGMLFSVPIDRAAKLQESWKNQDLKKPLTKEQQQMKEEIVRQVYGQSEQKR